jgi:hypothetical protein
MVKEKKNSNKFIKLVASGSINFELLLILSEQEAEFFNINPYKINKISDCKDFLTNQSNNFFLTSQNQNQKQQFNIFDNIRLQSNNNTLNTLLIINRAFKNKIFIEYITMNKIKFSSENSFLKEVLRNVTEQNFLFLVENNFLQDLDSQIKFTIKINNKIIASFENICDNDHSNNDNEINQSHNLNSNLIFDNTNSANENLINIINNNYNINLNESKENSNLGSKKILENSKENIGTSQSKKSEHGKKNVDIINNNNLNKEKENKKEIEIQKNNKSENENKFNDIIRNISDKIYDDFTQNGKKETNIINEHSQIHSNKELILTDTQNNSNNNKEKKNENYIELSKDNYSNFNLKEKEEENIKININNISDNHNKINYNNTYKNNNENDIDNNNNNLLKDKDSLFLNRLNDNTPDNLNYLNLEITSPVPNKFDKTQNENDITADKIIKDIHIKNSKSKSSSNNLNLNSYNNNEKNNIYSNINNIENIFQQNSNNEKNISITDLTNTNNLNHNINNYDNDLIIIDKKNNNDNDKYKINNNIINEFILKEEENIFDKFRYDFSGCNYFFVDMDEIIQLKKNNFTLIDFNEFINKIVQEFPEITLITNFSNILKNISTVDTESLDVIGNIIKETDIHIFDKKESLILFNTISQITNIFNNNIKNQEEIKNLEFLYIKELKKKRLKNSYSKAKIGIFLDELKNIKIIQQEANSDLIVFHSDYNFKIISDNISTKIRSEYDNIFEENFSQLKSVFIGGVLSRLFYNKSFNVCFTAGNEVVKRVAELIRFKFDPPADLNYYLVNIKKEKNPKNDDEDKLLKKKEELFILDSTNKLKSQMKNYNPLHDNNLNSFFSSKIVRTNLQKKGLIKRNGEIIDDPEKKKIADFKDTKIIKNFENEKNNLIRIRDQKEKMKLGLRNLLNNDKKNYNSRNLKDVERLSKIYNYNPLSPSNKNNKLNNLDLKKSTMKTTKFKNLQYLKQIEKGEKPISLFDMKNTVVIINKKGEKDITLSPGRKTKISSFKTTNNRFFSISTQRNISRQNIDSNNNNNYREISTKKISPIRNNKNASSYLTNFNNIKDERNGKIIDKYNNTTSGFRKKIEIRMTHKEKDERNKINFEINNKIEDNQENINEENLECVENLNSNNKLKEILDSLKKKAEENLYFYSDKKEKKADEKIDLCLNDEHEKNIEKDLFIIEKENKYNKDFSNNYEINNNNNNDICNNINDFDNLERNEEENNDKKDLNEKKEEIEILEKTIIISAEAIDDIKEEKNKCESLNDKNFETNKFEGDKDYQINNHNDISKKLEKISFKVKEINEEKNEKIYNEEEIESKELNISDGLRTKNSK